jgi:hypothetical protein
LNIADHIRAGEQQHVSYWHAKALVGLNLQPVSKIKIATRRYRYGANRKARIPHEWVFMFKKPKEVR